MSLASSPSLPVAIHRLPLLSSINTVPMVFGEKPAFWVKSSHVSSFRLHRKSCPVPFPTVESQIFLLESSNRRNNIALDGMSTRSRLTTSSRSKSVFGGDLYKPSPVGIHQL